MKIKIEKKIINEIIERITKIVGNVQAIPILKNLFFEVNDENVIIKGSNGNISMKEIIKKNEGVEIFEKGEFIVKSSLIKELVKRSSNFILIEKKENANQLTFISNDFKTNINIYDNSLFPALNFDIIGKKIIINKKEILKMLKKTEYASSLDITHLNLNTINVKIKNNNSVFSSTDRFRAVMAKSNNLIHENKEKDEKIEFNLFNKNTKCFEVFETINSSTLSLILSNDKILIYSEKTFIVCNLIDDNFPKIEKIFPKSFANILTISTKNFLEAINKASIFSNTRTNKIKISYNKTMLKIFSKNDFTGEIVVNLKDFKWEGVDKFKISVNHRFLRESVQKIVNEKMQIKFNEQLNPFIIIELNNKNVSTLITPLRDF